jgi:hypothetical protein
MKVNYDITPEMFGVSLVDNDGNFKGLLNILFELETVLKKYPVDDNNAEKESLKLLINRFKDATL